MKKTLIALSLALPLLAGGVHAANVEAKDPKAVLAAAKSIGSATLGIDHEGDPQLEAKTSGVPYIVWFYGCTNGKQCKSVAFSATFNDKVNIAAINSFNAERRYVKAYLNDDGEILLEMDVYLGDGGVAAANLKQNFSIWKEHVEKFRAEVLDR